MKRLEIEPHTDLWMQIRNESLTASMAAVFFAKDNAKLLKSYALSKGVDLDIDPLLELGLEDFFEHTLWTLWADKEGRIPRFKGNAETERGVRNEDRILDLFESNELILVERDITATKSNPDDWILASFDGLAPASSDMSVEAPYGFPIEAKCPAFPSRKKLWDSKKEGNLAVMGLPYYWCQIQHQIMVAEAPYGWFVAAGVEEDTKSGEVKTVFPIIEKVPANERVIAAYKAAIEFYYKEFILGVEEPPKLESDEKLIESLIEKAEFDKAMASGETGEAIELYLEAKKAEDEAVKRRKELEAKVIEAAKALRDENSEVVVLAGKISVSFTTSQSVSWTKVAAQLASESGMSEIPKEVIEANKSNPRESIRLREV